MIIVSNDYWKDFSEQETGSKPLDKVEMELSAGVWTDVTDYYIGGATFDQEKERAPDKISAGDTRYTFDNTEDTFTPTDSGSIFYGIKFHGKSIRYSIGFHGLGYMPQSVMKIKDVKWDYDEQRCYIQTQEVMQRLIDEKLNIYPSGLIPVAGSNTGNGTITEVATLPFAVDDETWTLTCTTPGGDGVGIFEVLGSVSGDIGDATSGTEFSDSTAGIKFTIDGGGVDWVAGGSPDTFTFTTYQYPEYTTTNPVKIIWNLITGYDYDSDTQSDWNDRVLELDSTQSVDNTDINYTSFVNAIVAVDNNLTGYIPYDQKANEAIEGILIHFLGSIYTDNKGRIGINAWKPTLGEVILREFADTAQVFEMNADEDTAKIINKARVYCKKSASWAWSNASETTDDVYTNTNSDSITDYGLKNSFTWTDLYWHSVNRVAQEWFIDRLIDKFGKPPLEIDWKTGLDGIRTILADRRKFTDSRTSFSSKLLEIIKVSKDFEANYKTITLTGSDTGTDGVKWCFLGSSADEEDGISPQNADWDSASDTDKQFCYLSTTGSGVDPRYYLF